MSIHPIQTREFDYSLPETAIARYPLPIRNQSKLLIYKNKSIYHKTFSSITNEIPEGYLLVFNNAKVIPARWFFKKETGALLEIFLLEPYQPSNYDQIFNTTHTCQWKCFVGNAKKWKDGLKLQNKILIDDKEITIEASMIEKIHDAYIIEFTWNNSISFQKIIEQTGNLPIPPYLKRETEAIDIERYQTIFSKIMGSVAAPTASLHFTEQEFDGFKKKNIHTAFLTLHVGAGTFKPITTTYLHEHTLHTETFVFTTSLIEAIIEHFPHIIAVGTTSLRSLESIFQLAQFISIHNHLPDFIDQWSGYNNAKNIEVPHILNNLLQFMYQNELEKLEVKTQLMISPGYPIQMVQGLITNFHQPKSSLLALVAAFIGDDWKQVYQYALQHNFRFLSYGDSSLLWK